MTTIHIPVQPSHYGDEPDQWRTETPVLHTGGGRRWYLGFIGPDGKARQVYQGPVVPGPWAYAFESATVIDNFGGTGAEAHRNRAAGIEHDVHDGQLVEIRGHVFRVVIDSRGYVSLALVDAMPFKPSRWLVDERIGSAFYLVDGRLHYAPLVHATRAPMPVWADGGPVDLDLIDDDLADRGIAARRALQALDDADEEIHEARVEQAIAAHERSL